MQRHPKRGLGVINQALNNYMAYFETLLAYGHDGSQSHLTNEGDFSAINPPNEP
jgi:hypothetical protein